MMTALLSLVAGISGLLLAWRSYGLARREARLKEFQAGNQHRSGLIDDLEQVLDTLREEYNRLKDKHDKLNSKHQALRGEYDQQRIELEQLRRELGDECLKRVALEERLEIERQIFSERMEVMEEKLKRLGHLETNA